MELLVKLELLGLEELLEVLELRGYQDQPDQQVRLDMEKEALRENVVLPDLQVQWARLALELLDQRDLRELQVIKVIRGLLGLLDLLVQLVQLEQLVCLVLLLLLLG
jgi:hypothetical protein